MQSPETSLTYLGFQFVTPRRLLKPSIRSYWSLRRVTALSEGHEAFMHPTGGYGIVFNFGDALQLDHMTVSDPIFLDGANTISRKAGFSGQVDLLGIRFREGGAFPILGMPLSELRNELGLLDALDRARLLQLHAQLHAAQSLAARITLLEEWLIGRISLNYTRSPLIPASISLLKTGGWNRPIATLAQQLAVSQRQLERLYQSQVGMSPKQYACLLRVDRARLALKQLDGQTTTRIGTDLGYFDQSHFIREFNAVVGMTPYAYMKRSGA